MIPGIVAHLWQSTLFLGAAWLLTLALRKNRRSQDLRRRKRGVALRSIRLVLRRLAPRFAEAQRGRS